ncbi:hypothetical protein BV25DRAFT_1832470 [Artomyces pyxidatus]|uniref:Uncharacterized protein n=1 Tax=Artomyces pyxidatus TaxID=48021 RepID=A0ACB8SKM2_9AGAM|nr:hypothetical protein BV25DRAFT_1832470 [Artomyces pyxidatus]
MEREEAARQEREKAQKERERQEREKEELERARKEKERLQRERQEQERQEKVRSENARRQREAQAMADAFAKYEAEWNAMHGRQLTFGTIPWPVQVPSMVRNVSDLTERGIKEFLLSEHHSKNVSAKQRIREALLRWHPDRLVTTLAMVVERDRVNVEKGANIVTGILNGL